MGERAVVARHRRLDRYDLSRTQWANTVRICAVAKRGECPTTRASSEWKRCGRIRWEALVDGLDYLSLDLCVRCDETAVRLYLPVWLGIPAGDADEIGTACGLLLRVGSVSGLVQLRGQIRGCKERLGREIESGSLETAEARRILCTEFATRIRYVSASARRRQLRG
ncbi:hypothetical protein GRX03_11680 [Halovenus sp. WSH3]|uniref:Uncharacterized protein n=1 Tax=Halovenus carboxidivorans TaxID=2692199 RepID=A0A6B0TBH4_9EURY|nr:hypothetical protein [Halovenus carboxidivorans]MXR52260.1 hypothetical protein [Halovenus carboxidivorans]